MSMNSERKEIRESYFSVVTRRPTVWMNQTRIIVGKILLPSPFNSKGKVDEYKKCVLMFLVLYETIDEIVENIA